MIASLLVLMQIAGSTTVSTWVAQPVGTQLDLHAVRAVDRSVVWAAGDHGIVAHTADGGITWYAKPIYTCTACRIAALAVTAPESAVVVSGSRPARIYLTGDAGRSWQLRYESDQTEVHLSAAAFFDARRGFAAGQVEAGRFLLLTTEDGGATWKESTALPASLPGERISDASGTAAVAASRSRAFLGVSGTGGGRMLRTDDGGATWTATPVKLAAIQGIAFVTANDGIAVGAGRSRVNAIRTSDGGRTWSEPFTAGLGGAKDGISYVPGTAGRTVVAVGPSDSAISTDGGASWKVMDRVGSHAVSFAAMNDAGWRVGDGGSVQKLLRGVVTGAGTERPGAPTPVPVELAPALGRTKEAPAPPPGATPTPVGARPLTGEKSMSN